MQRHGSSAATSQHRDGPQRGPSPGPSDLIQLRAKPAALALQLPAGDALEQQESGWRFHLSRMALNANRSDLGVALQRTLAGWFSAWNEADDAARLETLRGCCADDVSFHDEWAVAEGSELLALHIANSHKFMPGWKLESACNIRICRGEVLFDWRAVGPGDAQMEGTNHARVGADGTLRRVVGFPAP